MLSHIYTGNGCWSQPLVMYIRYTQAKWVVGHVWLSYKMFLLNSSVSFLEYTDRKVFPYLVIVGNPLPNTCLRSWLYTIYVEREMKAFLLVDIYWYIDIILISKGFWYKDILDSHKGKTRSVLRRGLMRYRLLVQTVLNYFTHTSPMTDPEFICFVLPKLLGA